MSALELPTPEFTTVREQSDRRCVPVLRHDVNYGSSGSRGMASEIEQSSTTEQTDCKVDMDHHGTSANKPGDATHEGPKGTFSSTVAASAGGSEEECGGRTFHGSSSQVRSMHGWLSRAHNAAGD